VAFGRKVDQIQVTRSWYATSVDSIPSEEKMNQYDFDSALKKYLSGQQTSEEEQHINDYLQNNPLNEIAVFESEKDLIGKRIKRKLYRTMKSFITLIALSLLYCKSFAQPKVDSVAVFLKKAMKELRIPGLQVAVVQHGKLTRLGAYGPFFDKTGKGHAA
jgi:hypothetical protein